MDDGGTGTGPDIMHVPVAVCSASVVTLRTARLASGERVGLAFTTQARLAGVCGPEQASILMHLGPLRAMLRPGGIAKVVIDPLGLKPIDAEYSRSNVNICRVSHLAGPS